MIELTLGSWLSRVLAITAAVMAAGVVWFGVFQPLQNWHHGLRADLEETSRTAGRLKSALEQANAKTGAGARQTDAKTLGADFLQGVDDPLIIADVQTRLRAIVIGQNGELNSARALPARRVDQQDYIGLRLQLRGTLKGVHAMILAIEQSTPFLFVERAQLRMEERRGAVDEALGEAATMVAELDVYGAKWPTLPGTDAGQGVAPK